MKIVVRVVLAGTTWLVLSCGIASAQTRTWTSANGGNGLFSNTLNWAGSTVPGAGNALVFDATTGTTALTNDLSITNNDPAWAGITFNAGSPAYTISGAAMTMANNAAITNNSSLTQTINTDFVVGNSTVGGKSIAIAGTGGVVLGGAITQNNGYQNAVTMNGQGTFTLNGTASNNMNLIVNSGTVLLAKTAGAVAFGGYGSGNQLNGGVLMLGGTNQFTNTLQISGGTFDLNGFNMSQSGQGVRSLMGVGGVVTNNAAGSGTNSFSTWGNNSSYGGTIRDGGTARVSLVVNGGRLYLSGSNAYSGGTTLGNASGNGVLSIASTQSIGTSGMRTLTFGASNAGTLQVSGTAIQNFGGFDAVTFASGANVGLDIQDASNTFTMTQGLAHGAGQFRKLGAGTLVMTASSSYTGATTLAGGVLQLDASQGGRLAATSAPTFAGGVLRLTGSATGSTTQSLGNVTLNAGGGGIVVDGNGGGGTTLALGTLADSTTAGSELDIQIVGSGTVTTTTTTVTNGLLGNGRVTFRSGANADFAAIAASGTPRVIQAATYTAGLPAAPTSATTNYSQADSASVTTSGTVNALKITTTTSGSLTIATGQTLSFASGGLLFAGTNSYQITGGTLAGQTATNSDLIVQQFGTGTLTIGSTIGNGNGASTLTKAGPGVVELSASNTYTGQTFVTGGTLSISSNANLGAAATGATLNLHGGVLRATATLALDNAGANKRAITVGSAGGGFDVTTSSTLTVTGAITAEGQVAKTGGGTLTLSSNNLFYGGLRIDDGAVVLNSGRALNDFSNVNVADLAATAALSFGSGAAPRLALNGNGALVTSLVSSNTAAVVESNSASAGTDTITVYNGADNTFAGILRNGSTRTLALGKTGAGTLFLTNTTSSFSGGLSIFNGRVSVSQATLGSGTVTFSGGGLEVTGSSAVTFANGLSAVSGYTNTVTISNTAGATFSGVVSGSGSLTKNGAGSLTLSNAANVFAGSLTNTSGTISFTSLGSTAGLIMAGGNFTATGGNTTVGSLAMNAAGTLFVPGAQVAIGSLTGSSALTVTGSAFSSGLKLTGTASTGFSGSITVGVAPGGNSSFLVLTNENALGTNADALTVGQAGGVYLQDGGTPLTIANHRINVASGGVTLSGVAATGDMTITGGITGSGGVAFRSQTSRAIVVGGAANDYTGQSTIYTDDSNNSTVRLAATNTLPFGAGKGNLVFAVWSTGTASLDLGGYSVTVNGLNSTGNGTGGRIIDNVSAGGNVTLTLGAGNATGNTFGGIIRNTTGTVALTKIGTGVQTLSGTNTYSGATTISAGTLALGANGSFGSSPAITIGDAGSSGAVLDLTAKSSGFTFGSGQTVKGIGTINIGSGVTVTSSGIWAPGNSIGSNAVTGNLSLSGTSQFEFGTPGISASSPGTADFTSVSGTLTLGGNLALVDNANAGGRGSYGAGAYRLFTYGAVSGSYASIAPANATTRGSIVLGGSGTSAGQGVFLNVYNLASAAASQTVNLGNGRAGTTTGAVTLTNSAPTSATFTETLSTGGFSNTSTNFTATGSASAIAGGTSGSGNLLVGLGSGLAAGAQTGTTTLALFSNAVNSSGLAQQSIGSQTITITGGVYDFARASYTGGAYAFGNVRTGSAATAQTIAIGNSTITNASYQDLLNVSGSTTNSAVTATGFNNLAASTGGTTTQNLSLSANTATAGSLASTVNLTLVSNANGVSGLSNGTATTVGTPAAITTTGGVYDFARATFTGTTLDFGVVHLGASVTGQNVAFGNQTVTNASYQDSLDVSATTGNARVTATGFTGLAASASGTATNNLAVSVSTATAGSLASTLSLTLTSNANSVAGLSNGTAVTVGGGLITTTGGVFSGTGSWNQATGGSWGTGASSNWTSAESVAAAPGTFTGYATSDAAILGSAVSSGTASIALNGAQVSLASIKFDNATARYVIASGTGAGSLALATSSGKPVVDVVGIHEIAAAINGTKGLQKTGLGTLVLSASNTYSGGTDITAGTLAVNGSLGGAVNVASGAALGGSGVLNGLVTVAAGGILAPGNSPGTLTLASGLVLDAASILNFELNAANNAIGGGINDLINVTGNFTLDGILNVSGLGDFSTAADFTKWRLFNYSGGTFTNNTLTLGTMPSVGATGKYFQIDTATQGQVNLVIVPEPAALALAVVGILGVGWSLRRRGRHRE